LALTRRGKAVAGVIATLAVVGGATGAFLLLNGDANSEPVAVDTDGDGDPDATTTDPTSEPCPLTGVVPSEGTPDRPVLAIKVEESSDARPQVGLDAADIVVEQPVEGNLTRLIAIFHCRDAERVGPVRSARFMDAAFLPQFGSPLFGYAGGAFQTKDRIKQADIVDLSYTIAVSAFERDPSRPMPHNLYTSTDALYEAGGDRGGDPVPAFTYSRRTGKGTRATSIHLPYNPLIADISWEWDRGSKRWLRSIGGEPAVLEDGSRISARNVVVLEAREQPTDIFDASGTRSYEVIVIGSGRAFVFRGGKMIQGTWSKESPEDPLTLVRPNGSDIDLAPGNTWVSFFGNPDNTLRFVPSA
jgi:DUF3048 family protein